MDQEIIRQLRELTGLAQENNKILHSLQRAQRWSNLFSWIKWAIIIALTLWSYVVIQPYLDQVVKNYQGIQSIFKSSATTTGEGAGFEDIKQLFAPRIKI